MTEEGTSFTGCYCTAMLFNRTPEKLEASEVVICFQWGGIHPSQRSGYGAVRYIGLTTPQVSSNEILQYILQDIVKCSTTGLRGVYPWEIQSLYL
jgi:hypothetical protein